MPDETEPRSPKHSGGVELPPLELPPSGQLLEPMAATDVEEPQPETSVPRRSHRKRNIVIAAIVAGALVVGGGAWAGAAALLRVLPPSSPSAAVERVFDAAAGLDPVRLGSAISPAEISTAVDLGKNLASAAPAASSGATPSPSASLQKVLDEFKGAVKISVSGLKLTEHAMGSDASRVDVVAGTFTLDGDADKIADLYVKLLGSSEGKLLGGLTGMVGPRQMHDVFLQDLKEQLPLKADFADTPLHLVTVHENGGWYVSPLLSAAEAVRSSTVGGGKLGTFDASAEAKTYSTPEKAVSGFASGLAEALSTGNTKALAATLPLPERRLVAIYGPALAPGIPNSDLKVGDVKVTPHVDGDLARIDLDSLGFTAGGLPLEISGTCLSVLGQTSCLEDQPPLDTLGASDFRLVTVRDGDGWHVSAIATLADIGRIVAKNAPQLGGALEGLEDVAP